MGRSNQKSISRSIRDNLSHVLRELQHQEDKSLANAEALDAQDRYRDPSHLVERAGNRVSEK